MKSSNLIPLLVSAVVLTAGGASPTLAPYDVWGGNTWINDYYYKVDTFGYTKLGSTNRSATFYGNYNYYVVATKHQDCYLDAARGSDGNYYHVGDLATGNVVGDSWMNISGPPDGKYLQMTGGGGTGATYGSFVIFYNPGNWTSFTLYTYMPPLSPVIVVQPEGRIAAPGQSTTFKVGVEGEKPLYCRWAKDGVTLTNGGRFSGATTTNLTITGLQAGDAGEYTMLVTNSYGSATSSSARLKVAVTPASFVLKDYVYPMIAGNEWIFEGTDYDGSPAKRMERVAHVNWPVTSYTGRSNPHSYVTNLVHFHRAYANPNSLTPYDEWEDYFSPEATFGFWGSDDDSESFRVDGGAMFPEIVKAGQTHTAARDMYEDGIYSGTESIQMTIVAWEMATVPAGVFDDCLRIKLVLKVGGQSETQEEWWAKGIGCVKHRNVPDIGEERLDLVSYHVSAAPQITQQPQNVSPAEGESALLSVAAIGSEPLAYQWRKNGVAISGETDDSLSFTNMQPSDVGNYDVIVTNDFGSVTSKVAVVSLGAEHIAPMLSVVSHTDGQLVPGKSITLTGTASDDGRGGSGITSVKVNSVRAAGDTASGSGTANWSRTLNVAAGLNTLTVVAADGVGNATTNIIHVTADPAAPVLTVLSPKSNQSFTNALVTVSGKVADAGIVTVFCQLNGGSWLPTDGTTNWVANLELTPGPNTFKVFAQDAAGNRSSTNTLTLTYVLKSPFTLLVLGNGTVTPALNGQWLELNKAYRLSSKPGKGFALHDWTGAIDGVIQFVSNKTTLNFLMKSNLSVTATFVDVQKPAVLITSPKANQRFSNSVATVTGRVLDNSVVARVSCQINDGDWFDASGTTNWTADVSMTPGPNTFRVYAEDATGNRSATNRLVINYVLSAPIVVQTVGNGTVTPNYNGQWLEVGRQYTMTAKAASGFALKTWTGETNGTPAFSFSLPALNFVMQSNLVITAEFADGQKPLLKISSPTSGSRLTDGTVTAEGTASDNQQVKNVFWRLDSHPWETATGTTNWSCDIDLEPGPNSLSFYAVDAAGNCSTTNTLQLVYLKDLLLTYWPMHNGDWKTYDGPLGQADISFSGGPYSFSMVLETPEDTVTSYYSYSTDFKELRLTGGRVGWTSYSFNPVIVELTETLLLNGGTQKSSSSISVSGQNVSLSVTVKVGAAGTVTVPAGTFNECKRIDLTITATIPGQGSGTFSAEAYILAPRVGMIRVGAFQASGSSFKFIGWEDLTDGVVNGQSVHNIASTTLAPLLIPATDVPLAVASSAMSQSGDPGGSLELVGLADGQLELVLRGNPDTEYFIETGFQRGQDIEWQPFWIGTLPGGQIAIPVDLAMAGQLFRLRPDSP